MKKTDKFIVIRVSVEDCRKIENAVYVNYMDASNKGKSGIAEPLKSLWLKLWKLLEIEDD